MSQKKRHHYLPKFYLEGFTNSEGLLAIYDRDNNEFRTQTPINTAVEKDYYTIIDEKGEKKNEVEDLLSFIEGVARPIIEKLKNKQQITYEEKENLSLFVALMWTRVPDYDKSLDNFYDKMHKRINKIVFPSISKTKEILEEFERKKGKSYRVTPEQLFKLVNEEKYDVETSKGYKLYSILEYSLSSANYFSQMDWLIVRSTGSTSFITTDNPFCLVPPENYKEDYLGYGIITKGTQKITPITEEICLVMLDKGDKFLYRDANKKQVFDINVFITDNCDRFVIGNSMNLIQEMVNETKIDKWRKKPRFKIS